MSDLPMRAKYKRFRTCFDKLLPIFQMFPILPFKLGENPKKGGDCIIARMSGHARWQHLSAHLFAASFLHALTIIWLCSPIFLHNCELLFLCSLEVMLRGLIFFAWWIERSVMTSWAAFLVTANHLSFFKVFSLFCLYLWWN